MHNHLNVRLNVADRLAQQAAQRADSLAVVCPRIFSPRWPNTTKGNSGNAYATAYATATFGQLDAEADRLARGMLALGIGPGKRIALLVPPSIEFVALVFALLRTGATAVLIDAGMGRKHMIQCLEGVRPDGFVAIPIAQAVRSLLRRRFPAAKLNVTVGRRWFWGGPNLEILRQLGNQNISLPDTQPEDPAAIIFTSGSTGPPKGVLYTHRMFVTQVDEIQSMYNIAPGEIDMSCFPLFGLFNSAMGVTTVLPEMDFSRPATANPEKLLAAANDWQITQSFASPAVWDKLSTYCQSHDQEIKTLRNVFSCGAPIPARLLERTLRCVSPDAQMHTPYGATECLPVATIEAREVLDETAEQTDQGAGICVGRKFDSIEWKVIRITDEPISNIDDIEEVPTGEIGELIVRGPQVSPEYVTNTKANATNKIAQSIAQSAQSVAQSKETWHRIGDVGHLDADGRFWYCGRKSQRVQHRNGDLFTVPIESVFNTLPNVRRTALVGVGKLQSKAPLIVVEFETPMGTDIRGTMLWEQWCAMEPRIEKLWYGSQGFTSFPTILVHPSLPVDVRHNAKINREQLAKWAETQLAS